MSSRFAAVIRGGVKRQIVAFAADAGDDIDRYVGIRLRAVDQRRGQLACGILIQAEVGADKAHVDRLLGVFRIECDQVGIERKARFRQSVIQTDIVRTAGAGAGAAERGIVTAASENVDLRFLQRERFVLVGQKHDAFFGFLQRDRLGVGGDGVERVAGRCFGKYDVVDHTEVGGKAQCHRVEQQHEHQQKGHDAEAEAVRALDALSVKDANLAVLAFFLGHIAPPVCLIGMGVS